MIEKEVIDNFLPDYELKQIQSTFLYKSSWTFAPQGNKYNIPQERTQFVHTLWDPISGVVTPHGEIGGFFIEKINPKALIRIKANLQLKDSEIHEDPLHVDFDDIEATTSIFYVNTCNGYTHFKDGSRVNSVENRLVTFPTQTLHGGANCTDQNCRIVINFNYH
tara:strand:- start:79 stop:570 length:492 start_codon:yes stop_codon:yes gene_type:complete